jgi:hypothetical protein
VVVSMAACLAKREPLMIYLYMYDVSIMLHLVAGFYSIDLIVRAFII